MDPSSGKIREYVRRLYLSRLRILCNHAFFGLLLMHMKYSIDEQCDTAYTDGTRIAFDPKFLDELSDSEVDFVMMHEILHVALKHCLRGEGLEDVRFNIAADIVANSNILLESDMDTRAITLGRFGEAMHLAPDGKEGFNYTAEEVYAMLPPMPKTDKRPRRADIADADGEGGGARPSGQWDDHSRWDEFEKDESLKDVWAKRIEDACEAIEIRERMTGRGLMPAFAKRILKELRASQTDWRTILSNFVQEEITDYSFTPPDRRFSDGPFFLPDFNEKDETVEDVLFMIDTSGSMDDDDVVAAYSEVKGALDQFDGKLRGWLGFFDAAVIEPRPFEDVDSLLDIKPAGGGGTDFAIVFKYVFQYMQDRLPASIIVLTDGCAPFPKESAARGIPVLWLLNNEKAEPPWGKVARITV